MANPNHHLRVQSDSETTMNLDDLTDEAVFALADPIMDNLMDASTHIDHERHVRDFSERLRRIVDKAYLESVCKQYQEEKGYFSRREHVGVFKRPGGAAVVWRQWFTRAPGEYVAEMLLVAKDGKFVVDHVMVF